MRPKSLMEQAEENVAGHSKPPKYDPGTAGITGLAVAGAVVSVFIGFAGIDSEAVAIPILATCVLGFGFPYFILRSDQKRHQANVIQEYERLRKEQDADRT